MIESFAAFLFFFTYFQTYCGISPGELIFSFDNYTAGFMNKTQAELTNCQNVGSSIYFVTLVIVQFGNMLATRTQMRSFFTHNPFVGKGKNLYLFFAMMVSLFFAIIITEFEFFNNIFQTGQVPVEYWFFPIIFLIVLFFVDELRKLIYRNYCLKINEEDEEEITKVKVDLST